MIRTIRENKIHLVQADITEMETDAIVNAANSYLKHGGGVAGAIVKKGGYEIQEESNKIGYVPVGKAVVTSAGKLKTRWVIHAVGPRMGEGDEDKKLADATQSSLELAEEHNIESIAFPAISTGIFGFPIERCAVIMLDICVKFLKSRTEKLEIFFCLWSENDYRVFESVLDKMII